MFIIKWWTADPMAKQSEKIWSLVNGSIIHDMKQQVKMTPNNYVDITLYKTTTQMMFFAKLPVNKQVQRSASELNG